MFLNKVTNDTHCEYLFLMVIISNILNLINYFLLKYIVRCSEYTCLYVHMDVCKKGRQ